MDIGHRRHVFVFPVIQNDSNGLYNIITFGLLSEIFRLILLRFIQLQNKPPFHLLRFPIELNPHRWSGAFHDVVVEVGFPAVMQYPPQCLILEGISKRTL